MKQKACPDKMDPTEYGLLYYSINRKTLYEINPQGQNFQVLYILSVLLQK